MVGRHQAVLAAVPFALVIAAARPAHALQDSLRGPFYVQGVVGSFAAQTNTGNGVYWHPDVEFGWHPTGRHDGFVVGVRQGFDVGNCSLGETVARLGYDIALPLRNGRFELTIAPYGVVGLDYMFPCGPFGSTHPGLRLGAGIEIKFFLYKGFYLLARPAETALAQYADVPDAVRFYFNAGIGVGVGF